MRTRALAVLNVVIFGVLLTGCQNSWLTKNFPQLFMSPELSRALNAPSINFRTVEHSHRGFGRAVTKVFKSQAEVDGFLAELHEVEQQNPAFKEMLSLDFSHEIGVLVALGGVTGPSVEITAVEELSEEFVVHSVRWMPEPGVAIPQMVTNPIHYVAFKKSEKPVTFVPMVQAYAPLRPKR